MLSSESCSLQSENIHFTQVQATDFALYSCRCQLILIYVPQILISVASYGFFSTLHPEFTSALFLLLWEIFLYILYFIYIHLYNIYIFKYFIFEFYLLSFKFSRPFFFFAIPKIFFLFLAPCCFQVLFLLLLFCFVKKRKRVWSAIPGFRYLFFSISYSFFYYSLSQSYLDYKILFTHLLVSEASSFWRGLLQQYFQMLSYKNIFTCYLCV